MSMDLEKKLAQDVYEASLNINPILSIGLYYRVIGQNSQIQKPATSSKLWLKAKLNLALRFIHCKWHALKGNVSKRSIYVKSAKLRYTNS